MPGASEAIAAIDVLIAGIDRAMRDSVRDVTGAVERAAKEKAPVRTGTLRRSILPTPTVRIAPHVWAAKVGPTTVYGRQKELGGHIYPVRAKALRFIARDGALVFAQHVYQYPQPFLKPATDEVAQRFNGIIIRRVGEVILSI